MNFSPNLNAYLNILSLVSLAVVGFYVVRSKVKNENLNDLKERVDILEKERSELRSLLDSERATANEQHLANQTAIAKLEGEVKQYRDLKLASIADHLQNLDVSNKEILLTLQGSAKVAAHAQSDGGLLVKTKPSNPLVVKTKESNPLDVKPVEELPV